MFTRKVHRKLGGNFTFLVLTDREDLNTQIYKTFAGTGTPGDGDIDPVRPEEELLDELAEAIELARGFLAERGTSLDDVTRNTGFARNAAILACNEAANENDETRKRFEILCRQVFTTFKACINVAGIHAHRPDRDAIDVVYKQLQWDRDQADITGIIRQLHQVVDEAIETRPDRMAGDTAPYDISGIDFERLKREFERSPWQRTTVQSLKAAVEQRLMRLLQQNPLRTDFQQNYEQIVTA